MKYKAYLFILVTSFCLMAQSKKAQKYSYRVTVNPETSFHKIEVMKKDKLHYTFQPEEGMAMNIDTRIHNVRNYKNPVLVTIWQVGVTAQTLVILNLKNKNNPELLKITSPGEINCSQEGDKLHIMYEKLNENPRHPHDSILVTQIWPE